MDSPELPLQRAAASRHELRAEDGPKSDGGRGAAHVWWLCTSAESMWETNASSPVAVLWLAWTAWHPRFGLCILRRLCLLLNKCSQAEPCDGSHCSIHMNMVAMSPSFPHVPMREDVTVESQR